MDRNTYDDKYIDLLLNRCLDFSKSKILFINYSKEIKDFVNKIIIKAKKLGISEIYLDEDDIDLIHDELDKSKLIDIESSKTFNKEIWDFYADRNATFLMIDTEYPGLMDDIDPEKISKASYIKRSTRPLFREKEGSNQISWCIAAYPSITWANDLFEDKDAYDKLYMLIMEACMIDTNNPIDNWDKLIDKNKNTVEKLNELCIETLHYQNSLGTNLYISLPKDSIWVTAGDSNMLVNMPSYEIFTSPNYKSVNGIVYSSKPLLYNGGLIEDFYLEFKDGKVIDYSAKVGYDILKGIIDSDEYSSYLGEVALVNYDSPISNTNVVYKSTLFDENASCHLALGDSFPETIKGGLNMTREDLMKKGLNHSKNHVDFMIGTEDLVIDAKTKNGNIRIFDKGNFCI